MNTEIRPEDIAIIGMGGRFPGADNLLEFWHNLYNGIGCVKQFDDDEMLEFGIDPELLESENFIKAGAPVKDVDMFDPDFFGYSNKEARMLDPQHRLFLETAWEALESSGCDTGNEKIGVFAGCGLNRYALLNRFSGKSRQSVDFFQMMIANEKDFLATRVAHKLNLKGPAVTVQSACSTSLVAVHLAVQSLLTGDSTIALAGGVSIRFPQAGYLYQQGMILSPEGRCRAFDKNADGTVPGNGLGIVVLKCLEEALMDGNYVHAVIKGSAVNNDGFDKVGFTAPSVNGQYGVISDAMELAGVRADSISYVAAHGTGTLLGDPVEIAALNKAFDLKKQKCAVGSLKPGIGHLDAAAGVASLIQTVLMLKYKTLVPSLEFKEANPNVNFKDGPFYVNTELRPWERINGYPLRAGVSSFGIGGTNAHIILEEAPEQDAKEMENVKLPFNRKHCWMEGNQYIPGPKVHKKRIGVISEQTPVLESVIQVWEKLFEHPVQPNDDFFKLNGESLQAIQALSMLSDRFNIKLPSDSIVRHPTPAGLSNMIEKARKNPMELKPDSLLVRLHKGPPSSSILYLVHPVGGHVLFYKPLAKKLTNCSVYGIRAQGINGGRPPVMTIKEMAQMYIKEIKANQPEGPYYLGGSSFGGVIAFEMACLLSDEDIETQVIMIDSPVPGQTPQFKDDKEIIPYFSELLGVEDGLTEKDALKKVIPLREDEFNNFFNIFKANLHALLEYRPGYFNGKLIFFNAMAKNRYFKSELSSAWYQFAMPEIHDIPGNHITMNMEPNVNLIADILANKII